MKKLNCVIVDDDTLMHGVLGDICKDSPYVEVVAKFDCSKRFLEVVPYLNFDICILDICMPEIDGISVARRLVDKQVIFVTGIKKKAIDAIGISAVDIILKPVERERLIKAIEKAYYLGNVSKAKNDTKTRKEYDSFNTAGNNRKVLIRIPDICFVTTDLKDPRNKSIVMRDGQKHTLMDCTLERLLSLSSNLIQISGSELVSTAAIHEFERDVIVLKDVTDDGRPKHIRLSRRFREKFLNRISFL